MAVQHGWFGVADSRSYVALSSEDEEHGILFEDGLDLCAGAFDPELAAAFAVHEEHVFETVSGERSRPFPADPVAGIVAFEQLALVIRELVGLGEFAIGQVVNEWLDHGVS